MLRWSFDNNNNNNKKKNTLIFSSSPGDMLLTSFSAEYMNRQNIRASTTSNLKKQKNIHRFLKEKNDNINYTPSLLISKYVH